MAKRNPFFDPSRAHHREFGFVNLDPEVPIGGDFGRWRRERRRQRLPPPPRHGYPCFIQRWYQPADFSDSVEQPVVWWLGHASVMLRLGGQHIITDPHLSARASPLPFLGPRRKVPPATTVAELPKLALVLISHNHYDHLDATTIRALRRHSPRARYLVPLGLAGWLRRRGIDRVHELDWWQRVDIDGFSLHCVPAQHWSARGLHDRNRTLWCGWLLRGAGVTFHFAGDTGYSPRLAEIGRRLGPIDLTALPIGAYQPRWFMRGQHIDPSEAVRLWRELGARYALGIHWGCFELTDEPLDAPPEALQQALVASDLDPGRFWLLRQGGRRVIPR